MLAHVPSAESACHFAGASFRTQKQHSAQNDLMLSKNRPGGLGRMKRVSNWDNGLMHAAAGSRATAASASASAAAAAAAGAVVDLEVRVVYGKASAVD